MRQTSGAAGTQGLGRGFSEGVTLRTATAEHQPGREEHNVPQEDQ